MMKYLGTMIAILLAVLACRNRPISGLESSASAAPADIYDRIDSCEHSNSANGCIFDLLRELAHNNGNGNGNGGNISSTYCECRVARSEQSGFACDAHIYQVNYWAVFQVKVLPNGQSVAQRADTREFPKCASANESTDCNLAIPNLTQCR